MDVTKTKFYAFRSKVDRTWLDVHRSRNEDNSCDGPTVMWTRSDKNAHVFDSREAALAAISANSEWYNSDDEYPMWSMDFDPNDYELVEFELRRIGR